MYGVNIPWDILMDDVWNCQYGYENWFCFWSFKLRNWFAIHALCRCMSGGNNKLCDLTIFFFAVNCLGWCWWEWSSWLWRVCSCDNSLAKNGEWRAFSQSIQVFWQRWEWVYWVKRTRSSISGWLRRNWY